MATTKKTTTGAAPVPVAIVTEEAGTFALALVTALPPGVDALLLVSPTSSSDGILGALSGLRGESLSYGIPTHRRDLERRYPASQRVRRLELPIDLGIEPTAPAPAPTPARWERPDAVSEAEAQRIRLAAIDAQRRAEEEQRRADEGANADALDTPASSTIAAPILSVAEMERRARDVETMTKEIAEEKARRQRTRHRDGDDPPPKAAA